ncbi:pheromone-processing carboxypeptidase KEX1-like [Drosophila miranda]|uniref:pheromone-processing carboxypeptidase KEX1-like n=1 Tax=Drosophila miranda TaxID=7229 RepID=UPI00143F8631|nr:pheromone-processing carboxypeptidase KEX1-like [Drosophila miranda]
MNSGLHTSLSVAYSAFALGPNFLQFPMLRNFNSWSNDDDGDDMDNDGYDIVDLLDSDDDDEEDNDGDGDGDGNGDDDIDMELLSDAGLDVAFDDGSSDD